jgi:hypothetical protein
MCVDKMEKTGKTPSDFLIRVQQHPATRMLLTALNKSYMAGSDEGVYLDGCIRERGTIESDMLDDIADYLRYTIQFLKKLGDPSEKAKTFYRWRQVSADLIVDLLRSCPKAIDDQLESGLLEKYVKENDNFKWRVVLPCTQTKGNRFSIPETDISFLKLERYDKLDHDPYSYSFAVSDISQERAGSLPSELPEKDVRSEIRDKRKEPLLIINIFDLYQHLDKKERTPDKKELIKTSVPFFSLSFPGSLASPKFKPLLGFMYNECVREQLRREKENEENADDLGDEDD